MGPCKLADLEDTDSGIPLHPTKYPRILASSDGFDKFLSLFI